MYKGLCFADIHIGAMDYEQTEKECKHLQNILEMYTKEEPLDFIIIAGDFFDKQLYTNDKYIHLALDLMTYFIISARVVRLIDGTNSHDSNQCAIFDTLAKNILKTATENNFNARVINTVSEEELLPRMKVLYIPEEYIFNKDEYYRPYLAEKDKYDYIFGHGLIYEAFKGRIKKEKTENLKRRKAPIFSAAELSYACKGDVIFGHYHVHTEMDGNVSYVGSFSRWIFGEEEDKGFYQIFCDPDSLSYTKEFIINKDAKKYITVIYGYKDSVFSSAEDMEKMAMEVEQKRKRLKIDELRLIFNIPVGYENPEALLQFITNRFKEDSHIKLVFNNGYVEHKKIVARENVSEMSEEYKVFLDQNVPEEDKLSLFLKIKRGIDMSPEIIKKLLFGGGEEVE